MYATWQAGASPARAKALTSAVMLSMLDSPFTDPRQSPGNGVHALPIPRG